LFEWEETTNTITHRRGEEEKRRKGYRKTKNLLFSSSPLLLFSMCL
jgi:hypothetical protein